MLSRPKHTLNKAQIFSGTQLSILLCTHEAVGCLLLDLIKRGLWRQHAARLLTWSPLESKLDRSIIRGLTSQFSKMRAAFLPYGCISQCTNRQIIQQQITQSSKPSNKQSIQNADDSNRTTAAIQNAHNSNRQQQQMTPTKPNRQQQQDDRQQNQTYKTISNKPHSISNHIISSPEHPKISPFGRTVPDIQT